MQKSTAASRFAPSHQFHEGNPLAERNALRVMILTIVMMVFEIAGGWYYNSMALLADGWHMSSHALALGLAVTAYAYARKLASDQRFAFGTWKIEVLGGYTSALMLVLIAGLMVYESGERLLSPSPIFYNQAILIAVIGLLVNLLSVWMLGLDGAGHAHHGHAHNHSHGRAAGPGHAHDHVDDHDHDHDDALGACAQEASASGAARAASAPGGAESAALLRGPDHQDLNMRSAYVHVLTDAATSVLAIVALLGGRFLALGWLDPVMGLVGAVVVLVWAVGLLRESGGILLDAEMNAPIVHKIREIIAAVPIDAEVYDLHVWRVGKGKYACIVGVATDADVSPEYFRRKLEANSELAHITVEINKLAAGA